MADTLYFSRDTQVFVKIGSAIWTMPVLDGFSFSQATNASEVTLNEMSDLSGNSRRARQMFTDSYAPAEWSFSTYARPFISAGSGAGAADGAAKHHAVEEVLWAMMVGDAAYSSNTFTGFTADATDLDISFASSNKTTLGTADIFFVMGGAGAGTKTAYKIAGCCVNEASLDFDIDGIATINWSGFGTIITEQTSPPTVTRKEAIGDTTNFIRNRLTELTATSSISGGAINYALTLTGGSITMSNNMTFLTPETLGVINQPLDHVTGTRSISGSFTCYLSSAANGSMDLWEDLIGAVNTVTNSFALTFGIGGGSTNAPRVDIAMPACHLEVPVHSIDDIISVEMNFHALGTDIESADELSITYVGK